MSAPPPPEPPPPPQPPPVNHPQDQRAPEWKARGRTLTSLDWWFGGAWTRPAAPSRWASASFRWWDLAWVALPPIALFAALHVAQLNVYQPEMWTLNGVAFAWMLAAPLIARRVRSRNGDAPPRRSGQVLRGEITIGLAAIVAGLALSVAFGWIVRQIDANPPPRRNDWSQSAPAAMTSDMWLWIYLTFATTLGPIAEECFYRGFLQHALGARLGVWVAATIQIALFAGLHFAGVIESLAIGVTGGVFTALVLWRRSLTAAIVAHVGNNAVAFALLFATLAAPRPWLGVVCDKTAPHCRIVRTTPGSPAERAGLVTGDVIEAIDGQAVVTPDDFGRLIRRRLGPVRLDVRRGSTLEQVRAEAVDRKTWEIPKP